MNQNQQRQLYRIATDITMRLSRPLDLNVVEIEKVKAVLETALTAVKAVEKTPAPTPVAS